MLELYEVKVSRAVLRGGNTPDLPDKPEGSLLVAANHGGACELAIRCGKWQIEIY